MEGTVSGNYPSNQNVTADVRDIPTVPTVTLQDPQNTTPQIERDDKGQITKGIAQDTNKNGTAGRPCEYCQDKDAILQKTTSYFELCWQKMKMPFVEELSLELDKDDDTIVEWAKKKNDDDCFEHPEFSAIIKKLKTLQKLRLMQRILGRYNATGGIYLLKVNYGMIEAEKRILAGESREPLEIIITEEKPLSV